jgi:hypothetical protein
MIYPWLLVNMQCLALSDIHWIGVIGAGQMGTGIAQVLAQHARKQVLLYDNDSGQLRTRLAFIGKMNLLVFRGMGWICFGVPLHDGYQV